MSKHEAVGVSTSTERSHWLPRVQGCWCFCGATWWSQEGGSIDHEKGWLPPTCAHHHQKTSQEYEALLLLKLDKPLWSKRKNDFKEKPQLVYGGFFVLFLSPPELIFPYLKKANKCQKEWMKRMDVFGNERTAKITRITPLVMAQRKLAYGTGRMPHWSNYLDNMFSSPPIKLQAIKVRETPAMSLNIS